MDLTQTEAYKRGVEEAIKRLARRPEPDGTVSVSLDRRPDRSYFKMCLGCTWAVEHCTCEE